MLSGGGDDDDDDDDGDIGDRIMCVFLFSTPVIRTILLKCFA